MTIQYIIPLADMQAVLENVGGKGASLARLAMAGLPVPGGFHITTEAYRQFVAANNLQSHIIAVLEPVNTIQPATLEAASQAIYRIFMQAEIPAPIAEAITKAYLDMSSQPTVVAVRSSATAEDLPDASFAGQQETYLNISGAESVLEAVKKCWASLWTARAISYRVRQNIAPQNVALAVVVQELVFADAAGILFTANPMNGRRDEMVINAAWGLGEAIVGGLVTPDTLTIEKASGRILKSDIPDKQVMTVRTAAGTEEQPVPAVQRQQAVLTDGQAAELVQLAVRIEQLYGMPMDIEWALADDKFAIVQARPITALPSEAVVSAPEIEPPTEWVMPHPKGQYVRASISELMPEPLTPLFGTLGRAAINRGTQRLMAKLGNMKEAGMEEMVVTINDYAYYTTRFTPKQLLMLLTHMPFTMPRMVSNAEKYWREVIHTRYVETIERWQAHPLEELSAADILVGVRHLAEASFDVYAHYQSGLFARASLSEILFTRVYNKLIKRHDDPEALTYLVGFDSIPIRAEKSIFDIAEWCRTKPALTAYVTETPAAQLAVHLDSPPPDGLDAEEWLEWQSRWETHLREFGHIIYDLDFAKPLPVDDPAPLLDTCKMFLSGQCPNPYDRQKAAAEKRQKAVKATLGRLKGLRRKLFRKVAGWAQDSVPLREEGLADLGLGYPQLRRMLREMGRRLFESGVIAQPDDVFWLLEKEVDQAAAALDTHNPINPMEDVVKHRKAVCCAEKQATPPPVLPPKSKFYGLDLGIFVAAEDAKQTGDTIRGAGTSPGRVTGVARVLHGPQDFDQMQPGDILVAKITTPAWTPLFARAAAVITDIGGPLSHGSIVAREYAIPAVMGTGVATKSIRSGQTITVDGSSGEVVLHKTEPAQASQPAIEWTPPDPQGVYMRSGVVDLMPKPLSPLYASIAIPALIRQEALMAKHMTRIEPEFLNDYFTTINAYAFANTKIPARLWAWILFGLLPAYPTILHKTAPLWRNELHPDYLAAIIPYADKVPEKMSFAELWQDIQALVDISHYYIAGLLFATMGASAGGEGLLTQVYNKFAKQDEDPEATALLMGWDNIPVRAEKSLYDLAKWCRGKQDLAAHLVETPSEKLVTQISSGEIPVKIDPDAWKELQRRFAEHLKRYGYIIFQLDFAEPLPLDNPQPMIENIKMYLRGEGANPYERQRVSEARRIRTTEIMLRRLKGFKRWAFRFALNWGQPLAEIREDALAEIGRAYPILRDMLRELGRRFAKEGIVEQAEDIFWLEKDEIDANVAALERGAKLDSLTDKVIERRAFNKKMEQLTPPPMIPYKKKIMGIKTDSFIAHSAEGQSENVLKGVATSSGKVTAPACVLRGSQDFGLMRPGDVLVAATTTPAWTPLFAMASAVVTDIGGPLSHGSIVAREYGIPAVMGTGVATRRIQSGQTITVDGDAGTIMLSNGGA
ncbi:MAG: hypothetical protein JW908_02675 [Anaerolineales bacterium]|nr:hypothetical protein [Anaerolineales bacterium]